MKGAGQSFPPLTLVISSHASTAEWILNISIAIGNHCKTQWQTRFSWVSPIFHVKVHQSRVYRKLEDVGLYRQCEVEVWIR